MVTLHLQTLLFMKPRGMNAYLAKYMLTIVCTLLYVRMSLKRPRLCSRCLCPPTYVLQRYVLEKAAPCLAVSWPALVQVESAQEHLFMTPYGSVVQTLFKLGVMIVNHNNKFVCMFR